MELPQHFPSPHYLPPPLPIGATASSTTSTYISTSSALLKACNKPSACSFPGLFMTDDINHHQLYQRIQVCYEEARISRKSKQLVSMREQVPVPTIQRMCSLWSKVDDLHGDGFSTFKDEQTLLEEEGTEEVVVGNCPTPPYVQSMCNATNDHDCISIRQVNDNKDPILDADLVELRMQTSAALAGDKEVIRHEGEIYGMADQGLLAAMCAGCNTARSSASTKRA